MEEVTSIRQRIIHTDVEAKAIIQQIEECTSWNKFHKLHQEFGKLQFKSSIELEEMKRMVDSTKEPVMKENLVTDYDGFRSQYESNYRVHKRVSLDKQRALEKVVSSSLMDSESEGDGDETPEGEETVRNRKRRADYEAMTKKAAGLTDDLMSIAQMMTSSVMMSEQSLNTLVGSSATVNETQEEFRQMGNLLGTSRKLLGKYGRREVTDKLMIFLALAFFFGSCLYVFNKRFW